MNEAFNRFYTSEVKIYNGTSELCTIKCDIQSHSAALEQKDYGFCRSERLRLYCGENEFIKAGAVIKYKNDEYVVENVFEDELGMSAQIRLINGYERG